MVAFTTIVSEVLEAKCNWIIAYMPLPSKINMKARLMKIVSC